MHFLHLLRALYVHMPAHLGAAFYPFEYLYRFARCLRLDMWSVKGQERTSCLPLSAVVALPREEKTHLLGLMFTGPNQERHLGRVWSWRIRKVAQEAGGHSLVVTTVEKPQYNLKTRQGWLVIPNWVRGDIKVPFERKPRSTAIQSDLKKIRDHKLEFEITRDPRHIEDFYREMHVPYMANVYGDAAFIEPYEDLQSELQQCELLLVKKDGECISGVLIAFSDGGARLWLLGVRNGDRGYLKMGAIAAIYHFGLGYLHERGYSNVDLGWSRPFLKDGALRYKKKLGMQITDAHGKGMALQVLSLDEATRSFLQNNPFIVQDEHGLGGAVFVDEEAAITEEDLQRLEKDYLQPGLGRIVLYSMPKAGPFVRQIHRNQYPTSVNKEFSAPSCFNTLPAGSPKG